MPLSLNVLLCLLGIALAMGAHILSRVAEVRARERYREMVDQVSGLPDDGWTDVRPLVGRWGCLLAVLQLLRGVGLFLALGAGLSLIAN